MPIYLQCFRVIAGHQAKLKLASKANSSKGLSSSWLMPMHLHAQFWPNWIALRTSRRLRAVRRPGATVCACESRPILARFFLMPYTRHQFER